MSFISVSSSFARVTTLKKSDTDNSLIIRLVEMEGKTQNVELKLSARVMNLYETNLIEDKGIDMGQSGKILNLNIGKNPVETFH
ncbi:MAG: hypothetical protein K0M50_05750 [Prolixibacteraceae bacterium]|nr:hypothetical protein [Prolixibacteraceae bacterium]